MTRIEAVRRDVPSPPPLGRISREDVLSRVYANWPGEAPARIVGFSALPDGETVYVECEGGVRFAGELRRRPYGIALWMRSVPA